MSRTLSGGQSGELHLKGLAWGHTRGVAPLLVTSQIYRDFHPGLSFSWDQRSLWSFGEEPLEEVVAEYQSLT